MDLFLIESLKISKMALLVFSDSFPPFNKIPLPLFSERDIIWGMTSGLDSNTIPITPIGTAI